MNTLLNERVLLPQDLMPYHYNLEITPNFEALGFIGIEEIFVDVIVPSNQVKLHAKEINVLEASLKDSDGYVTPASDIAYNSRLQIVTLTFGSILCRVGKGVIAITYQGILNGDMAGFYRSSYKNADGVMKIMGSTQFAALDARRAFLCWDEPAVKATFSLTLIVPQQLTALSNMPEISSTYVKGSKKKVVFEQSPKMSTYLLAWVIGEFDSIQGRTDNGVTIRVFGPPGRAEQGQFALDTGLRALDFYDDYFQSPYPLPKLDMVSISEFAFGATENWGLICYREADLMIDMIKASTQQRQRVAVVVAHELAHQWFGNLVTMAWWDGLWLNEGFASYMEHFVVDILYPDYQIWDQYTIDCFGAAQRLDSLRNSHPIIVPIKHAEEVEQVFDAISYCKGSCIVSMLSAFLGKERFQKGLQIYMRRHAYQNTETIDLWKSWSEVSGLHIADLMSTWTQRQGYPYLRVVDDVWTDTSVEFTLEQAWFLADGSLLSEEEAAIVWSIPLTFTMSIWVSDNVRLMDQKVQKFILPLTGPGDWVKINAGQKALVRVAHSEEMLTRVGPALRDLSCTAVDRAALLLDSCALAKAGVAPVETIITILRSLDEEETYVVWSAMSNVFKALYQPMEQVGGSAFEEFLSFSRRIILNALSKVSWDLQPADGHTDKLMRKTVIGLLDIFAWNEPSVVLEARRRFDSHWDNPSAIPSEYKTIVYKIVVMNGGEREYKQVMNTFYATESNIEKRYSFAVGATQSEALKRCTLDWAVRSGDVKLQDFFYAIEPVSNTAEGAELAWSYYTHVSIHESILTTTLLFLLNDDTSSCIFW